MKLSHLFVAGMLLMVPALLSAQSYLGDWQWDQKDPEGNTFTTTMTFEENGTYTVDFQSDGTPEVTGKYSYQDGKMTIEDTNDENPCKGIKAVYALTIEGNTAKAKMISDPCEVRAGDGEVMVMMRKE